VLLSPQFAFPFCQITAFAEKIDCNLDECVCVDPSCFITCLLLGSFWVYRLSTTLVSRLVLNLREQNLALAGLPTTIETEQRFQAALPAVEPIASSSATVLSRCDETSADALELRAMHREPQ
jgi:hypothetical protein